MIFLRRMVESEVTSTDAILFTLLPLTFRLLKLFSSFFFLSFSSSSPSSLLGNDIHIYMCVYCMYVCVFVFIYIIVSEE